MRALVAEDDLASARLVKAAIEPQSFVVEIAQTGEDALELAKLYDFDIVLIDLRLPDIDGGEVVRRMRSANVGTPVLMLSASTTGRRRCALLSRGGRLPHQALRQGRADGPAAGHRPPLEGPRRAR